MKLVQLIDSYESNDPGSRLSSLWTADSVGHRSLRELAALVNEWFLQEEIKPLDMNLLTNSVEDIYNTLTMTERAKQPDDEMSLKLPPGVTLLVGRNTATQSSSRQRLIAVFGINNVSVKGDMDEAIGELQIDGETYNYCI